MFRKKLMSGGKWSYFLRTLAFLPMALALCIFSGCAAEKPGHNVILITIDTLRADHLGCYGYSRPTSPRMDAFASQATRYTRHFTSSPWTLPTHASLFTGLDPFEHGAVTIEVQKEENNVLPLPLEHLTLAEAFQEAGARTGAVVANTIFLSADWQVNQGFEEYLETPGWAPQVNQTIDEWLEQRDERPFFLFINYMDVHRPYNAEPRKDFLDPPAVFDKGELVEELYQQVMPGTRPAPEELRQQIIDQYDTSIANVDEWIGRLLDKLEELDLYENTQIILTSDHGEYFGEHHLVEHSKDVYQEALWAPLIVKDPGQQEGRVDEEIISSIDIPFLIFSQFAGKFGEKNLERFPAAPGEHLVISENRFTRTKDLFDERWGHRFKRVREAVYDWPYKYIHSSDSKHELYDLVSDPREEHNLYDSENAKAQEMQRELKRYQGERMRAQLDKAKAPPWTEEQLELLREFGYMK